MPDILLQVRSVSVWFQRAGIDISECPGVISFETAAAVTSYRMVNLVQFRFKLNRRFHRSRIRMPGFLPTFVSACKPSDGLRLLLVFVLLVIAAPAPGQHVVTEDGQSCGSLEAAAGPYDYTNPIHRRDNLPIVEAAHLGPQTISLKMGTRDDPGGSPKAHFKGLLGDLNFTLRAFPNHHIALDALARLHLRENSEDLRFRESRALYSMACWFARAETFKPDDPTVRLIHGIYLYRLERYEEALKQYKIALQLAPKSAEIHYNTGLLYMRMQDYDAALEHAVTAYELGYPLPGLKNALQRRNVWTDDIVIGKESGMP